MRRVAAILLAFSLVLLPGLASARPGLGSSFGSRGSMTYSSPSATRSSPYGAAPMQRSITPYSTPGSGFARPYAGGFGRSGFGAGLLGGFIGAGLGGMLLGRGFFGGGMGGMGFIGFLLQMVLLFFVGRWLLRMFMGGGRPAFAGAGGLARMMNPAGARPAAGGGFGGAATRQLALQPTDYRAFEQVLRDVQGAWTARDLTAMGGLATPEMVGYFGEQLAELSSRGVRNTVTGVQLLAGDLSQAWAESGRQYATVSMRFSMLDVTRDGAGHVVDGSETERVTATEYWTFLRATGGRWLLSAIQQTR